MLKQSSIALVLALLTCSSFAADTNGWFGFGVDVNGSGVFWNPIIELATINKISPDSPASASKLRLGYTLQKIDGHAVVGARAKDLQPLLNKRPGEELRLSVGTPEGELNIVLEAATKPEEG